MLGVPGVYVDQVGRGYTDELEQRYGLIFNFRPEQETAALEKALEILRNQDAVLWTQRRERMLSEKIDVTAYLHHALTSRNWKKA